MIGLDTTFIIDFLNSDTSAINKAKELKGQQIVTTQINMFEVFVGLFLKKGRFPNDMENTLAFFGDVGILPHNDNGSLRAAELMAESYKCGKAMAAADALVAGIMLSNGCDKILSRDTDFKRIKSLKVIAY